MAATAPRNSILIVDDHADTREGYAMYLRWVGYSPTEAASGEAALAAIARERPDVIVMDVRLQGMSGLALLGRLRADASTRGIPVIMLSGADLDDSARSDPGIKCFLQKPVLPKALLASIEAVVRAGHTV